MTESWSPVNGTTGGKVVGSLDEVYRKLDHWKHALEGELGPG
jgi:hypothetical protein